MPKLDASLAPRKAPKQIRAEQTVAAILEAAALVLETSGLESLNTNLVAQRAGVSIGSLYQYFPGKDALIVALSLRERALFYADLGGLLDRATGIAILRELIRVTVRQQLRRPTLARLLDFEERRPAIAAALAKSSENFFDAVRTLLTREDIPSQPDLDDAAHDILAILRAMTDAAGDRGEVDMASLEQRVARALFGYLGIPLSKI